jgi:RNA polymerase sigma factor (sigma-70 family)
VADLPQRQQEAVRLKFQGGLSYREIAEVMDTTANNVGVLLHTAIRTIRDKLATAGSGTATMSDAPGQSTTR